MSTLAKACIIISAFAGWRSLRTSFAKWCACILITSAAGWGLPTDVRKRAMEKLGKPKNAKVTRPMERIKGIQKRKGQMEVMS